MSNLLDFHGPNAGYVWELYDKWRADPQSVDAETRQAFAQWNPETQKPQNTAPAKTPPADFLAADSPTSTPTTTFNISKVVAAARLGRLVRELGHMDAAIDPLGGTPPGDPCVELKTQGLTENDLSALPASVIGGPLAEGSENALQALEKLRRAYSGSIGYEDDHIQVAEERDWLRSAVETGRFSQGITPAFQRDLLARLTEVELFEQYLHNTPPFQGQKRFSIEGCDMMVPILDEIIRCTGRAGTREVTIGMAHRGRLNVLAHVLGKPYAAILSEFPNPASVAEKPAVSGTGSLGYTGDVKYHLGHRRAYSDAEVVEMPITLAPNPSHLEFVNPTVVGRARAAQEKRDERGFPLQNISASLPILIHGDAAFPGQGVVAETLNLSQLAGYQVGGTIHIIANNQIGFTTLPGDGRSTLYASDLAKGFEIPIVHVNADDVMACIAVARMACAYRERFHKDFLIDLVGYRRWGHNEGDQAAFTQPRMVEKISKHPTVRAQWAEQLEQAGVLSAEDANTLVNFVRGRLEQAREEAYSQPKSPPPGAPASSEVPEPDTAVPEERLRDLNTRLIRLPDGFQVHPILQRRFLAGRGEAFQTGDGINWAHAEALAFGSLLEDAVPIRLTGQDSERGTFGQRNLVLHDVENGKRYCALQALESAHASFALYNSPLSESAAMGFEYGYSVHAGDTLVLWEGQFGDFANGAQVIIDQFLASARSKWGQSPSLVLLLPHGYDGQGPEHSSARPERFLQMCAGGNMRIANCTTPAQYFHLLRRQALLLADDPKPLIVMTPKSLLRHPRAISSVADLTTGAFRPVLDDPRDPARRKNVTRLVLCSGKVYVDLLYQEPKFELRPEYSAAENVAIARAELLYPFLKNEFEALLSGYPNLCEVVWLQEEPQNMGAWSFIQPRLREILPDAVALRYVGRPAAASPAEGSPRRHGFEQRRIIYAALENAPDSSRANGRNGAAKTRDRAAASTARPRAKSPKETSEVTK